MRLPVMPLCWIVPLAALAPLWGELRFEVKLPPSPPLPVNACVGRTQEDVIAEWGPPYATRLEGDEGSVLVYAELTEHEGTPPRSAIDPVAPPSDPVQGSTAVQARPGDSSRPRYVTVDEIARFTVDARGVVQRCWFHEKLFKSGVPVPPPRKKPGLKPDGPAPPPEGEPDLDASADAPAPD